LRHAGPDELRAQPPLRQLDAAVVGAWGVHTADTRLGAWLRALLERAHKNAVVVALANKLARIVWAVLARGECFRAVAVS
jgi:hypothetical protein